jgi:hypothetical protein
VRIALVPSAPLLLPDLGGGPDDLRSACQQAISVLEGEVTVLGGARPAGWVTGTVDATPYGAPGLPSSDPLPLPLAVGSALLGDRPRRLLAVDGTAVELTGDLLVVGDLSARRTEKAPGGLDPRSEGFDASVVDALRAGDPRGLAFEDLGLMVSGLDVWRTLAVSLSGAFAAEVLYDAAPYGVGYVVATWIGS